MNRLAGETSPYLRQHAANPVDWYPWGDEAFERAAALGRPVFISIGYSACHWCHVMAHESFEDEETAAALNEGFVSVKVDREEHPDVDAIYMEATQAMTGGGGWPLTVFADAKRRPFFCGTYFPKRATGQMPAFSAVLEAVTTAWQEHRSELDRQAQELTDHVAKRLTPPPSADDRRPATELSARALDRFREMYDATNGGLRGAPKFPQAPMLELVLRAHLRGTPDALQMVETSLSAMASGGIYDHLGGGFARYSVDATWTVPHFEKMLYDQASLARLYLHATQATGDERWRQVATETLDYVLRDLRLSSGGIASAEDADSEGEEGRFYLFDAAAVPGMLTAGGFDGDVDAVLSWYGMTARPNFEDRWILLRPVRGDLLRPAEIEAARRILFEARSTRVRPSLDDKVLTEWNAMAASVLAEAAGTLERPDFGTAAVEIGEFLLANLRREDGRLLRSFQNGRAAHLAVATDYAWCCDCFTRLAEWTGDPRWLERALEMGHELDRLFSADDGGFYLTGSDATGLPVRPRDTYDGVLPAAVSIGASALTRLGALLGDDELVRRAQAAVASVADAIAKAPLGFSHLIGTALQLDQGALEIVITGDRDELVDVVRRRYLPDAVLAWGTPTDSPLWEGRGSGLAYVCRAGVCLAPVREAGELQESIDAALARAR